MGFPASGFSQVGVAGSQGEGERSSALQEEGVSLDSKAQLEDFTPDSAEHAKKSWANIVAKHKEGPALQLDFHPVPSTGNGIVSPPTEILIKGIEKMKCCLVGKLARGSLPFQSVERIAHTIWDKFGLKSVGQKQTGIYIFRFGTAQEKDIILAHGGFEFARKPMLLQSWESFEGYSEAPIKKTPVWAKFINPPDEYWTREGLSFLASAVGKPLFADKLTENLEVLPFARICIEHELGKKLPEVVTVHTLDPVSMEIRPTEVAVEYPRLPQECSRCCSFGHILSNCPRIRRVWQPKVGKEAESGTNPKPVVGDESKQDSGNQTRAVPNEASKEPEGEDIQLTDVDEAEEAEDGDKSESKDKSEDGNWRTVGRRGKVYSITEDSDSTPPIVNFYKSIVVDEIDKKQGKRPLLEGLSKSARRKLKRNMGTRSPPSA